MRHGLQDPVLPGAEVIVEISDDGSSVDARLFLKLWEGYGFALSQCRSKQGKNVRLIASGNEGENTMSRLPCGV